jgi:hypothetical protein
MVWLGNNINQKIIEHTKKINSNCEFMLWINNDLLPKSWINTYNRYATIPQLKSDLIRLCALREYGGLYIDFDCFMKINAIEITKNWNNFTIPSLCYSNILPGNILYCPKEWNYWTYIDNYVINFNSLSTTILTFNHFLYKSLPQEAYIINNDCEKFPSENQFITDNSQIIRYRTHIPSNIL